MGRLRPIIAMKECGGKEELYFTSLNGLNAVQNALGSIMGGFPGERVPLLSDIPGLEGRLETCSLPVEILKIVACTRTEERKDPGPLLSPAFSLLEGYRDADPEDVVLFVDPLLILSEQDLRTAADRAQECDDRSFLAVRGVHHHPCLMFSMRDPEILDPFHPLPCNIPVTYQGLYRYDFNTSRLVDERSNQELNGRQSYHPFYESLKGLALFRFQELQGLLRRKAPVFFHGLPMEHAIYMDSKLDLLKASRLRSLNPKP